jgi:hypothetical protein
VDAHTDVEHQSITGFKQLKLSHFSGGPPTDWNSAVTADAVMNTCSSSSRGSPAAATIDETMADMGTFRPAMVADSLDGFLELSDEDERRQRDSKVRIRALSKKKQSDTKSTMLVGDDDENDDIYAGQGGGLSKASPRAKLSRVAPRAKPKTPPATFVGNNAIEKKEMQPKSELLFELQQQPKPNEMRQQDSVNFWRKGASVSPPAKDNSCHPSDRISQMVVEHLSSPDESGNEDNENIKFSSFLLANHSSDEEDGNNLSAIHGRAPFRPREVDL